MWVTAEATIPEAVTQNHDRILERNARFFRGESATEREVGLEDGKEGIGNELNRNLLWALSSALTCERYNLGSAGGQLREGRHVISQVKILGEGRPKMTDAVLLVVFDHDDCAGLF